MNETKSGGAGSAYGGKPCEFCLVIRFLFLPVIGFIFGFLAAMWLLVF